MHPVEPDIKIYRFAKSFEGNLVLVKEGFKSIEEAEAYIDSYGESKVYYVILPTYRRQ